MSLTYNVEIGTYKKYKKIRLRSKSLLYAFKESEQNYNYIKQELNLEKVYIIRIYENDQIIWDCWMNGDPK